MADAMRVVLLAGEDPGHAFPAAGLTRALQAAGHTPVLMTAARWQEPLQLAGIPSLTMPPFPPPRSTDFGYLLHGRAAEMAPALCAEFRRLAPDLVVSDVLAGAGALAAELLGVPWAELVPHPLHLPSRALPPPGAGLAPGRGPAGRARDVLLRRLAARSTAAGTRQRQAARVTLGLPADQPDPAARLIATLPALEPERPDWPPRTHVVGPLQWDPARTELLPPDGAEPLVLLVASTAGSGRAGLLETALTGLRGVRLAAVQLSAHAAALPPWAVAGPGRLGPLVRAADVVLAGGGHGMLSRSLAAGRPLVLVPGGGDQRDLARRANRAGAAIAVTRLSARRLARAVRTIVSEPSYAAAARTIAASGRTVDPVRVCEAAARGKG